MTFTTKTDASAWLAAEQTKVSTGAWEVERVPRREVPTVTDYVRQWIATRITATGEPLRPKTRHQYEQLHARHVADDPIGVMTLDAVAAPTCAPGGRGCPVTGRRGGRTPIGFCEPRSTARWMRNWSPRRRAVFVAGECRSGSGRSGRRRLLNCRAGSGIPASQRHWSINTPPMVTTPKLLGACPA